MKKQCLTLFLTLSLACAGGVLPVQAAGNTDISATATVAAETSMITETSANVREQQDTEETTRFTLAPSGISKDSKGNMYIADRTYNVLRKRDKNGAYTVLAGTEGTSGYKNGTVEKALFNAPWDVVAYKNGWLISDSENHVLRLYKNGKVTTVAGTGKTGYKNSSTGTKAKFNRPTGMATGKNGEVYISDTGNNVIRMIDKKGKVTTYAGGKAGCANGTLKTARFNEPTGLYYYKGALYVADSGNHRICKIENGKVTTVAGSAKGVEGSKDGSALKARLSNPQDMILYKDMMYISDTGNGCVRKLENGKVTTVISAFSIGDGRAPAEPCGLSIQGGKLYVGDTFTEELLESEL